MNRVYCTVYFSFDFSFLWIPTNQMFIHLLPQETKASDCEERAEEEDLDGHELIPSPDSGKSTDNEAALSPIKMRSDVNGLDHEECDELIHVENTTQACIMHALSIVSYFNILFFLPSFLRNHKIYFEFHFICISLNSFGTK